MGGDFPYWAMHVVRAAQEVRAVDMGGPRGAQYALRLPRERSVIGILLLAFVLAVMTAWPPNVQGSLIVAVALVVHLLTFDVAFERAHRELSKALLIIVLNAAPYMLGYMLFWRFPLMELAVGSATVLAYLASTLRWGYRAIPAVLTGTALLTVSYLLAMPLMDGAAVSRGVHYAVWALYALYNISVALYVESRLAFRNVRPVTALMPLTVALLIGAALHPAVLIAFVEPIIKTVRNIANNVRYSSLDEIKRMGKLEALRSALFVAVLGLSVVLTVKPA